MSLINEMLRDLEKRQKPEGGELPVNEIPVPVTGNKSAQTFIIVLAGLVVVAAIVWFGIKMVPGRLAENPVAQTTAPVVAQLQPAIIAPAQQKENVGGTELLTLAVVEADKRARLHLSFAQLPEYSLLPSGADGAGLVVSFNRANMGADFEIPPLAGPILKRISLLPQNGALRLLVDMESGAEVQSFQLVEVPSQGYQLLIDIDSPAIESLPLTTTPVADVEPVAEPLHPATVAPQISKKNNSVAPDQQAFNAALKQLENGDTVAAEKSLRRALVLNQELLAARLQLVDLLQRQQQFDQAEEVLTQGLALQPANYQLRKTFARLLLERQHYSAAMELLQAKPTPVVSKDLEYYALLAVLQQEAGQFNSAAVTYNSLLQVRPNNALWWFGRALATDQDGNYKQAGKAYRQALALPGLEERLRSYSSSRLQQL